MEPAVTIKLAILDPGLVDPSNPISRDIIHFISTSGLSHADVMIHGHRDHRGSDLGGIPIQRTFGPYRRADGFFADRLPVAANCTPGADSALDRDYRGGARWPLSRPIWRYLIMAPFLSRQNAIEAASTKPRQRSIARTLAEAGTLIGQLPAAIWDLVVGPTVSSRPFSAFAEDCAALLRDWRNGGWEGVIVLVARRLDQIDALLDLPVFIEERPTPIHVLFLHDAEAEILVAPELDLGTLARRLTASAVGSGLLVYARAETHGIWLSEVLGRPVRPIEAWPARLTEEASRVASNRPIALVVRPQWIKCGANLIFTNQIEMLSNQGFAVLEVLVNGNLAGASSPAAATSYLLSNNEGSLAQRTIVLNLRRGLLGWLWWAWRHRGARRGPYLRSRAQLLLMVQIPRLLDRVLTRTPPAIVVTNHCFNLPIGRKLAANAPAILESHDVQSHMISIVDRNAGHMGFDLEASLREEFGLLGEADWVVSLNEDETRLFMASEAVRGVSTIFPFLSDVRPEIAPAIHAADEAEGIWNRLRRHHGLPEVIDVLLVFSDHSPNIECLHWFFEQVFTPHLVDRNITVTLVGSAVGGYTPPPHPDIFCTGVADDMMPFYAASKTVALPIVSGTGMAIKTLEALSLGRPFVATRHALRGLGELSNLDFPLHDSARDFANDIVRLLASRTERERRGRAALAFAEPIYRRDEYYRRWRGVLKRFLDPPLMPADPGAATDARAASAE